MDDERQYACPACHLYVNPDADDVVVRTQRIRMDSPVMETQYMDGETAYVHRAHVGRLGPEWRVPRGNEAARAVEGTNSANSCPGR